MLACIAAGKPVLCEKPLATSAEAARADRRGRGALGLVTVGFMRRYDPGYVELKAQLDAGAIGAPLLVHCAHRNPFVHDFFDSAMIITDSAVHEVDVARWLLGEEIVRVTVHAPRSVRPRALRPAGSAAAGARDGIRPFGRRRGVRERRLRLRHPLRGRGGDRYLELPRGGGNGFQDRFASAYLLEIKSWLAGEPGPGAWDGYAAAAVCEAGVRALKSGRAVDVVMSPR